jgi:hypothetical protein
MEPKIVAMILLIAAIEALAFYAAQTSRGETTQGS